MPQRSQTMFHRTHPDCSLFLMPQSFDTEAYVAAREAWPSSGRQILAHYDATTVVVYQAYCDSIAHYAVKHNQFAGAPGYSSSRMSWIKTNYLWMMYRSGWGTKSNQNHVLAITLTREFFEEILEASVLSHNLGSMTNASRKKQFAEQSAKGFAVRLQWDPDHHPSGAKLERKAIQLGLKGSIQLQNQSGIVRIEDITTWVRENRWQGNPEDLIVPIERVYPLPDHIAETIATEEPSS